MTADQTPSVAEHDPALVGKAARAMRDLREARTGVAFGVASPTHVHSEELATAVLDAVAPDIRAEALRQMARDFGDIGAGQSAVLCIEAAQAIEASTRADRIEGGRQRG